MDKLFKAIAKHFPDVGKWFAIVATLYLGGHVLRLFGVPIEEYGRTISDKVFEFFETHFPEWPFLLLGLFVFGPFLGRTA